MITEEQRRALFALREALHLCEAAEITVNACSDSYVQVCVWDHGKVTSEQCSDAEDLLSADIAALLGQHPESTEHTFRVEQMLRCLRVPDRHEGYFTPGKTYRVAGLDTSDTLLPLLMTCDSRITLWCESSAFEATA